MKENTEYLMSLESEEPASTRCPKTQLNYIDQSQIVKTRTVKQLCEMKRAINKQIWENPQGNLEELFLSYPFCEQVGISANDLIKLKGIKLIRGDHRIYFGQVIKTKKQGKGISVYSDGKIYEGTHLNNQKNGPGCQIYTNGNAYIGNFDRNKKHGKGTFYWLNLDQNDIIQYYIGQWWDGLPSGTGKHQRCNGDLYQGQFRNGLKHGEGTQHFNNGDTYKGQYVNGLPEGYGQYIWNNQSSYKGEFKQGLRFGFGCWKKDNTENSESYRGHYLMDLKSGHGIYNYPDGKFYKGEFLNDKKHGFGELYHNQVLKYRGNWQQGKPSQNSSQIGENTLQRIRSNSGSVNSFQMSNGKLVPQSKSTHRVTNFKTRALSRQPTFQSSKNQIKPKRPSTGAPIDFKQLTRNSVYGVGKKQMDQRSQSHAQHKLKGCHKNCIPIYPWQRNKSAVKH